ncbi:TPA: hypothetical protein ACH3X2_002071 [Trebouxia sp. C0005]
MQSLVAVGVRFSCPDGVVPASHTQGQGCTRRLLRLDSVRRRGVLPSRPCRAGHRPYLGTQRRSRLRQPSVRNVAGRAMVQEGWPLWAALSACAAGGQVLEQRTSFGSAVSAPLLSLLLALALSAGGILPVTCPAYDVIWTYTMPMGAALYLLESDLRQLLSAASSTFGAFVIGAVGSVVGTIVAWLVVGTRLGPDGYKVAAALCASYIGGSVNFAAVSQSLGLAPGPLLAASMAADNIAMAAYLTAIMVIPAKNMIDSAHSSSAAAAAAAGGAKSAVEAGSHQHHAQAAHDVMGDIAHGESSADAAVHAVSASVSTTAIAASPTVESIALALAFGVAACAFGEGLAGFVGLSSINLAAMAVVASLFASVGTSINARAGASSSSPFTGSEALGGALMLFFFATIGAGAGSLSALWSTGWLTAFIAIQLSVHLAVIVFGGYVVAGLPMQVVLTASNANVGGPATAAAMAASRGWPHMVRPAMLTGSLGYAVGTGIGCAVSQWLQVL